MKKPKFLMKVDRNYMAKIYLNGKWHKGVREIAIEAVPWDYVVIINQYKLNEKGVYYAENDEIATETIKYSFGRKGIK